jgi:hypothetical protein
MFHEIVTDVLADCDLSTPLCIPMAIFIHVVRYNGQIDIFRGSSSCSCALQYTIHGQDYIQILI